MGHTYELSISEKNKKVLRIIRELRGARMNVSDKFCEYIIDGYEDDIVKRHYEEARKKSYRTNNTLDPWRTEEEGEVESLE